MENKRELPNQCYSVLGTTGEIIIINNNESGYYPYNYSVEDRNENRVLADTLNEKLGVTKEQEKVMTLGSMFGWDIPIVQNYLKGEEVLGGAKQCN